MDIFDYLGNRIATVETNFTTPTLDRYNGSPCITIPECDIASELRSIVRDSITSIHGVDAYDANVIEYKLATAGEGGAKHFVLYAIVPDYNKGVVFNAELIWPETAWLVDRFAVAPVLTAEIRAEIEREAAKNNPVALAKYLRKRFTAWTVAANAIVFNKVNVGSIKDYDGKVDWEAIDTEPVEMLFECKKYFAGSVDDIDKAQTNIDVIDAFASANMGEVITAQDRYAYGKYADGAASKLGEKAITSTYGIYDLIVDLGVALGEKNVPVTNRAVAIGWEALGLLEKDARFTHNPEVLANGIVKGQKINGMTVVVSNSAPAKTLVAMHKSAVGFGQQIAELEGMRLQNAFADGVRGLVVGGACVLNADGVATATYTV